MRICTQCYKSNENDAIYCNNCGKEFEQFSNIAVQKNKNDIIKKTLLLILVFLIMCCPIIILIINGFNNKTDNKQVITTTSSSISNTFKFDIPNNIFFGMKESEIINIYGNDYTSYNDLIAYNITFGEKYNDTINYSTIFGFSDTNELEYINYGILYNDGAFPTEKCDLYSDYEMIKNLLTEKLGTPSYEQHEWVNKRYLSDKNSWNKAFFNGDCYISAHWELEDYQCQINFNNNGISISYESSSFYKFYKDIYNEYKKLNETNKEDYNLSHMKLGKDQYNKECYKISLSKQQQQITMNIYPNDSNNLKYIIIVTENSSNLDLLISLSTYSTKSLDKSLTKEEIESIYANLVSNFNKTKKPSSYENNKLKVDYNAKDDGTYIGIWVKQ